MLKQILDHNFVRTVLVVVAALPTRVTAPQVACLSLNHCDVMQCKLL